MRTHGLSSIRSSRAPVRAYPTPCQPWNIRVLAGLPRKDWDPLGLVQGSTLCFRCASLMAESSVRAGGLRRVTNFSLLGPWGPRGLRRPRVTPYLPPTSCPVHCVCKDGAHGGWALRSSWPVWFQGFQRLKAAHVALEEEYLKACREQHLAEQLAGSKGTPRKFDPDRYILGREARGQMGQAPGSLRRGTL